MNKILVTGGAGFVGSHLCERLVKLGYDVTSLDNYFTGSVKNHVSGVDYISGSTELICDIFRTRRFDCIYHLGEYSRVEQSFEDIDLVWKFNKLGTYEVMKYVTKTGAKLIYAGSSTKFADKDQYIPSPYAWSKSSNTEFVKQYAEWFNIDYAITYFYNVYGKREINEGKYATLIAKYKTLAASGSNLPVVLPGTQKRNFTHIDDIVDGLILILTENGYGDEYGIGSSESFTILEVAELFGLPVDFLEPRKGNRMAAKVLTDKTAELGWKSQKDLRTYIEKLKTNGWKDE